MLISSNGCKNEHKMHRMKRNFGTIYKEQFAFPSFKQYTDQ